MLSAIVAAGLGALKTVGFHVPLISAIPEWFWWCAALLLLFGTAVFLQMSLEKERSRKPKPNMKLLDVVQRIRGTTEILGPQSSESMKVLAALESIRENALHGRIEVFGCLHAEWRSTRPEHYDMLVRHPIPADHWSGHTIDYMRFIADENGEVIDVPNRTGPTHNMIWFDRDQIATVWPPARRKIDWKNPVRFKQAV